MVIFPALLSGRLCLSSTGPRRETWGKKWELGAADAKSSNPSGKEMRVEGQWGCTSLHPPQQSPVRGLILLRRLPPPPCALIPVLGLLQGDPALPSRRGQHGSCQPGRSGCCFPAKAPACGRWPSRSRCAKWAQPRAPLLQLDLGSSRVPKLWPGPSLGTQGHELPCAQDAGPCQSLPLGAALMGKIRSLWLCSVPW